MPSQKVEIDNLSKCITEIFNDYVDEIDDTVKNITDETIKDAQKEVKMKLDFLQLEVAILLVNILLNFLVRMKL